MIKIKTIFLVLLIIVLISGCSQQSTEEKKAAVEGNIIMINHFVFEPSDIIVDAGTAVTWKHNDNVAHTVVSPGLFESKTLSSGGEFTFTFDEPGEYSYHCSIHPSMEGKVIVR